MDHTDFIATPGGKISLAKFDTGFTGAFENEKEAAAKLSRDLRHLAKLQEVLYAQDTYALLLIFQAMDAAGKDSTIKHVMSGVNPQGCQVFSFKTPSKEELDHDYLWRSVKALPERGRIGIFNRSYYEEVLVVRIHPEILEAQQLPERKKTKEVWKRRYEEINNFERYLVDNGIVLLKFFLHVSKEEQKRRFLDRIGRADKNWKFSIGDVHERAYWDRYQKAYEKAISSTSTKYAPWYIIPADHKWFMRVAVADIIVRKLRSLKLSFPQLDAKTRGELREAKRMLESEE